MDGIRPIYWQEGLFLRPQHFQQQDLYHLHQASITRQLQNHFWWGVLSLAVLDARLNNHIFEIENIELIFQDGTWVKYPGNTQLKPRSFETCWSEQSDILPVYVGVRRLVPSENNLEKLSEEPSEDSSATAIFASHRFKTSTANGQQVFDLFEENKKDEVLCLNYNVQLLFADEINKAVDFEIIKIAELKRFGNQVTLHDNYIPPLIHYTASRALSKMLGDIKEQLVSRAKELAMYKADRKNQTAIDANDLTFLLALRSLNRCVPWLSHVIDNHKISPWILYGALCQIIGELSTFSERFDLFGVTSESADNSATPRYDHNAIGPCFIEAQKTISLLLNELTAGPDYTLVLSYDGTYFSGEIDERAFKPNSRLFLCIYSHLPDEFVQSLLEDMSKIASRELLPLLIARALPGIKLRYLATPPSELPRREGYRYFEIACSGDPWGSLKEGLNIAVYLDNPPVDLSIELMVIYG